MAKININMVTGAVAQQEAIIGIDLGTTNSLSAYIDPETKNPKTINYSGLGTLVPSIIYFRNDGKIIVGDEAKQMLTIEPENTIYSVKRLLGKSFNDLKNYTGQLGYTIFDDQKEKLVKIRVGERYYNPIELSAEILKEIKNRSEYVLKTSVHKAVITVPAYFNDTQRQATRDAGKLAGLEVLRIVNEPTAASLAYGIGIQNNEEKNIVCYDFGGGTFDVSILNLNNGVFEVLSTNGDTWLGGDDFDQLIIEHWLKEKNLSHNILKDDKVFSQQIRLMAEQAKKTLSCETKFEKNEYRLSLEQFNKLAQPIVDKTIECCKNALKDAKISVEEIDEVVLVGGSTRIPLVYNAVFNFFKRKPHNSINPDEVVALGASIQADILAGNRKDILLLDVTPLSLGIETMGGLMDVIIPRNSKIPTRAGRQYTTHKDGQVNMKIAVYQGERDLVKDNRKLAEFTFKNIPAMPAGLPKVDINFILNADGILKIQAIELRSNTKQEIEVIPQYGLTDEEVENMLLSSLENAVDDMKIRSLTEAKTEALQLIYHAENFMQKHQTLLSYEEKNILSSKINILKNATQSTDRDVVFKAMDELDEYSKPIAERILDISISEAMKGKKIM